MRRRSSILLHFCVGALIVAMSGCGGSATLGLPQPNRTTGTNLILNGGAELGDATLTGYDSVTIPGWSESGLPTVVTYGVSGFPRKSTPGAGHGEKFFTGGPFSSSTLRQTIDVSSASTAIDAGGVKATLSGRLGGNGTSPDTAQLTASYRNTAGAIIGSEALGPVTVHDRKRVTRFLSRSKTEQLPAGTRSIIVTLNFTMYGAFTAGVSLDNGYADDISLTLSAPVSPPALPPTPTPDVPKFDHIFFVYFENSGYKQIIGNTASAPYINLLAKHYSLLSNYYALHHPSDANYVLQAAGGTYGLHDNDIAGFPIAATHLADLVETSGGSWKQYMESAHGTCDQSPHGYYFPDDGPYMYFTDVRSNPRRCNAHIVPFKQLAADLQSTATTPEYAWLSPDDCDDMEACGIAAGDTFLKNEIAEPLMKSPAWNKQNTLLIVAWDEDDFTPVNRIAGIFISRDRVKNGYSSRILYTHYSVLATIETSLGLPTLTNNDRYATVINDVWR
jgi:hypothetical protein